MVRLEIGQRQHLPDRRVIAQAVGFDPVRQNLDGLCRGVSDRGASRPDQRRAIAVDLRQGAQRPLLQRDILRLIQHRLKAAFRVQIFLFRVVDLRLYVVSHVAACACRVHLRQDLVRRIDIAQPSEGNRVIALGIDGDIASGGAQPEERGRGGIVIAFKIRRAQNFAQLALRLDIVGLSKPQLVLDIGNAAFIVLRAVERVGVGNIRCRLLRVERLRLLEASQRLLRVRFAQLRSLLQQSLVLVLLLLYLCLLRGGKLRLLFLPRVQKQQTARRDRRTGDKHQHPDKPPVGFLFFLPHGSRTAPAGGVEDALRSVCAGCAPRPVRKHRIRFARSSRRAGGLPRRVAARVDLQLVAVRVDERRVLRLVGDRFQLLTQLLGAGIAVLRVKRAGL